MEPLNTNPSENESLYLWKQVTFGFTIMELLIASAIVGLIVFVAFLLMNPGKQLETVQDTRRRQEFAILQRVFDDFYNDNEFYPTSSDVCYDPAVDEEGNCYCHVCGLADDDNPFSSYLKRLYCDPDHPRKEYLYQYDCRTNEPEWYRVCGVLSEKENPGYYNYGVASSNVSPDVCTTITYKPGVGSSDDETTGSSTGGGVGSTPTPTPDSGIGGPGADPTPTIAYCPFDPNAKFCIKDGICNVCGNEGNCRTVESCDQPYQLYSDYLCTSACY